MYHKQRLSNGLRVILSPLKDTSAVTVLALTNVGSRYETGRINGISHFLEHMMFKGTDKRPTSLDVSKELDGVGASFNAFTGKDYTGYYIKLSHEHLNLALDIIADMLWHSKFLQTEIERERHVIMEEINMYLDNPIMLLEDIFEERLFGKRHPLGRVIAGPKSVIAKINRADIVRYFTEHYFPANMVLCVAGKFRHDTALRQIRSMLGNVSHQRPATRYERFTKKHLPAQVRLLYRDTEQVQMGLGCLGLPYGHKDIPALNLLSIILGGNMSSRLFVRVREREGLAYSVHAGRNIYHDTGVFMVSAGVAKQRALPALTVILEELRTIAKSGVTAHEVESAREFIRGKMTIDLEDSEEIANFLAKQELLTGIIRTPDQRYAELQKVRAEDVRRLAARLFRQRMTLALIGPYRDERPFRALLTR